MKKIIILLLLLLLPGSILFADWQRMENDENNIRKKYPEFTAELYYDVETENISLVDNYSESIDEHLNKCFIVIDYLFYLIDINNSIEFYYQSNLGGFLSCWDVDGRTYSFEFWTNKEKMQRLYEIHLGYYIDNNTGISMMWPDVYRYFFNKAYDEYLENSLIVYY